MQRAVTLAPVLGAVRPDDIPQLLLFALTIVILNTRRIGNIAYLSRRSSPRRWAAIAAAVLVRTPSLAKMWLTW
jgi:hypothetical protein